MNKQDGAHKKENEMTSSKGIAHMKQKILRNDTMFNKPK